MLKMCGKTLCSGAWAPPLQLANRHHGRPPTPLSMTIPSHSLHRTHIEPLTTTRRARPRVYRVWAPKAKSVALRLGNGTMPMRAGETGWWTSDQPMRAGDVYGYVIDGEGPFPDPRSASQPSGVHGLSECVDHDSFAWTDASWQAPPLSSAVIYELHVGTFTQEGTFESAIARLPHLVNLGVTHVELMPVCEFPGSRGWGYDGVDLFAPHHDYGGPDGLKRLVDACHAQGLAVVLDVVYNHLGPAGNYLRRFGPYFTDRYGTPWGEAVNLDGPDSDEVRRFFCDNALMWLRDYHIDGLRLDAVHALIDTSATHFLEQLASEVAALQAGLGRHLVLIAESDLNDPRIVRSREAGGYGVDAQWSDDFHHALHSVITGERSGYYQDFGSLAVLGTAIRQVFVYAGDRSPHRGRRHGRPPLGLEGWRFVVAAQNHDQVGNRAKGERLGHLASVERLEIAAAILLTSPFVPMLFQGEEWAASSPFQYFTAHEDDLGSRICEGRRKEFAAFGWDPQEIPDPQDPETFNRSRLRWDELTSPPHAGILDWYRALIALRRESMALGDGDYEAIDVSVDDQAQHFVMRRHNILVVCNLAETAATIRTGGDGVLLLASAPGVDVRPGVVTVPPESVAIVEVIDANNR
jgi:maltooligosyltrehalose trehalohydrolase